MEKADHNGSNLSFIPSKEHATQKAENSKKGISLFRHCKRTNFSPSTFTPTDPVIDYSSHEMNGLEEVDLSFVTPVSKKTEEINTTTSNERFHNWSLPPKPAVRTRFSEGGSTGLRRGRPNTLASGLPSPAHHRSLEVKQNRSDSQVNEETTTGIIDTSPIQKHGAGEVNGFVREMQEEQENESAILTSKLNLESSSEPVDDITDQIPLDSDHDRAYTEESMLVCGEMSEFSAENIDSKVGDVSGNKTVTGSQSEATDGDETTLEPIECLEPIGGGGEGVVLSCESGERCKVLAETDSAVDLRSAATWSPKSPSPKRQSIQSQDSGLELILEGDNRARNADKISRAESTENVQVTTHNHSLMFMKEGKQTVSIRGSFRQKKAEARLEVTAEVHKLLSKAGAFVSNVDSVVDNSENVSEPRNLNLELHCYDRKMTEGQKLQSLTNKEYSLDSNSLLDGNVRIAADAARLSGMLPSPSFRKAPVLPVTTNLLRMSFRENCSQITPVVCQSLEDSVVYVKPTKDCPAKDEDLDKLGSAQTPQKGHCSSTHPKIKPALVTPGVSNCRGKLIPPYLLTSPLPKTIRTPLKPVKRLQSSPKSPGLNRLPRNIISPGKVVKLAEMTVASSSVNMDM